MVTDFPFFSRPPFQSCFTKRLWFFGNNVSVLKLQGFLLFQRGLIMLSFSETFFLNCIDFSALSPYKSKISEVHGHDCLNCKHLPNVCKFLLVLEAQILDTAFSSGVERCKSETFSISQYWGLPLVPLHPIITISSFIQCYLSYANQCKKSYFTRSFQCIYHPFT